MIELLRFHHQANIWSGVYELCCWTLLDAASEDSPTVHPQPVREGHNIQRDEYCAFKNQTQMEAWFPHWPMLLTHPSIRLSIFVVKTASILPCQTIFNRGDLLCVKEYHHD